MWLKLLVLIAAVGVVVYGFRALSGGRRPKAKRGGNQPPAQGQGRDGAVDLIRCDSCGAYTPDAKHCTSCGNLTDG